MSLEDPSNCTPSIIELCNITCKRELELMYRGLWCKLSKSYKEVLGSINRLMRREPHSRLRAPCSLGEDPIFLDEKDRKPLQSADLYAWQTRNHYVQNHSFQNQKIVVPMNRILGLFRRMPKAHYPINESTLKRQFDRLVRVGEQIKRTRPTIQLVSSASTPKERRKIRRQTTRQKRNKIRLSNI